MSEFIKKKLRSAKVFRICLLVLLIAAVGSPILVATGAIGDVETAGLCVMIVSMSALWISGIIYLVSYMPFTGSVKWLKNKNMEYIADDINLEKPTLPRSMIYCGRRALFSKKPCAIIPYSEIAWVHLYERSSYGITVEKAVIVYTKDGKKFTLQANADEFKWLLANYIIPNSPNIVLGYGAEQQARYRQLNPQSVEAGKRTKRIWGIVLMCIGAAFLIAMIINIKTVEIVPLTIMIVGLLGSGFVLYMIGKKK